MKQEMRIKLPEKRNIPATEIYIKTYIKKAPLGQRDILVMVPGGPGNDHSTYDALDNSMAKTLLPYVDILLFDPRGCGKSKKSLAEHCTLERYIEDIESIREHFKISSQHFILFGQSYGAIAALGYAVKYPEKLKKLILISGAASSEFLKEAQQNLLKKGTPEQKKWGEKIWAGAFPESPEQVAEYYEIMGPLYSHYFKPAVTTTIPTLTYNVEVLNLGFKKFLREFDYRPELSKVKCKTLILWGEDDWIADKKQATIIHNGITDNELVIFKHCSHLFWVDQFEKFMQKIIEFLVNK